MEDRLRRVEGLIDELCRRVERLERLYVSRAVRRLNPNQARILYAIDRINRESGRGATIEDVWGAVPFFTKQYVTMVINRLEDLGLVMRRKNPERKLKPRPHGAIYLFEIDYNLVPDVPSLLRELGYTDVVEGEPPKEKWTVERKRGSWRF